FKPSAHLIFVSCVSAIWLTRSSVDSIGLPPLENWTLRRSRARRPPESARRPIRCANSAALQPCRKPSANSLMRRRAPAEKDGPDGRPREDGASPGRAGARDRAWPRRDANCREGDRSRGRRGGDRLRALEGEE